MTINFPSMNAVIHVGRVIELTQEDRLELFELSQKLTSAIREQHPDVCKIVLREFRIVQAAVARSHAKPEAARE